jgi:hypothetical protein
LVSLPWVDCPVELYANAATGLSLPSGPVNVNPTAPELGPVAPLSN